MGREAPSLDGSTDRQHKRRSRDEPDRERKHKRHKEDGKEHSHRSGRDKAREDRPRPERREGRPERAASDPPEVKEKREAERVGPAALAMPAIGSCPALAPLAPRAQPPAAPQAARRQVELDEIARREKRRDKQRCWPAAAQPGLLMAPAVCATLVQEAPSVSPERSGARRLQERRDEKDRKAWHHRSCTRSPDRRRDRHEHVDRDRDRHGGGSREDREAAAKHKREREVAELDDEAERRRKRVEAWQVRAAQAQALAARWLALCPASAVQGHAAHWRSALRVCRSPSGRQRPPCRGPASGRSQRRRSRPTPRPSGRSRTRTRTTTPPTCPAKVRPGLLQAAAAGQLEDLQAGWALPWACCQPCSWDPARQGAPGWACC